MGFNASSSGFIPPMLVEAIRGEILSKQWDRCSRTQIHVEFWVEKGQPVEARVRSNGALHIVPLTS